MRYTFTAKGHENILATHKKTLEFTKDKELSLDGDCIIGVRAEFELAQLQKLVRSHRRLTMRISAGDISDEIDFIANPKFSSGDELVLRFSEFGSDRTLGFRATKSAAQISRELVARMRMPEQKIVVNIEPSVKVVVFDFDDTLVELSDSLRHAHHGLAQVFFERYSVYPPTSVKLLDEIDRKYCTNGVHSTPDAFDRRHWFEEYFRRTGIPVKKEEIDNYVEIYWKLIRESLKTMPFAKEILQELKRDYRIAVISDSDGSKQLKMARLEKTGLAEYFDLFIASDDMGINKPDRKFYLTIFEHFRARPEQCVMVGDKPQVDLKLAKELGMSTVWMKHGRWAKSQGDHHFDYADQEISSLEKLPEVIKQL